MLQIVISLLLLQKLEDLRSFERSPQKYFIWKATAKNGLLSLVVFGEARSFPFVREYTASRSVSSQSPGF